MPARWMLEGALFAGLFCLFVSCPAFAVMDVTTTEVTKLDFGTVKKPSGGPETYTIPANGGSPTGTGTLLYGTPSRGQYTLKLTGSGPPVVTSATIDIQNISSGNANVTISGFTGIYGGTPIASFPKAGLPLPSAAGTTLYLGATATYNSAVPVGPLTPSFDIVVTLQ